MHIPDGILDLWLAIVLYVVAIIYAIYAFKKVNKKLTDQMIPRLAVFTAMVFAFQMLNFPVAGGTSGHLLGYVMLAIIMGPEFAFIGIMLVLVIQAFIFADGGLLALGANIFNMTIVAMVGYFVYLLVRKQSKNTKKGIIIGSAIGAWLSVVIASIAAGIEIGVSQAYPFDVTLTVPAMLIWHVLIGIGEGAITAAVVGWVLKVHPEFLNLKEDEEGSDRERESEGASKDGSQGEEIIMKTMEA